MPYVSGKIRSKTLGRNGGWRVVAQVDYQMEDEVDLPLFADIPEFDYLHILSWLGGQQRLVGLDDEYEKFAWMFDSEMVGAGFVQLYCHPHDLKTDSYIYLGKSVEERWEKELDTALQFEHLEIELLFHRYFERHTVKEDRHGGRLLTFRGLPELSVSRIILPEVES